MKEGAGGDLSINIQGDGVSCLAIDKKDVARMASRRYISGRSSL